MLKPLPLSIMFLLGLTTGAMAQYPQTDSEKEGSTKALMQRIQKMEKDVAERYERMSILLQEVRESLPARPNPKSKTAKAGEPSSPKKQFESDRAIHVANELIRTVSLILGQRRELELIAQNEERERESTLAALEAEREAAEAQSHALKNELEEIRERIVSDDPRLATGLAKTLLESKARYTIERLEAKALMEVLVEKSKELEKNPPKAYRASLQNLEAGLDRQRKSYREAKEAFEQGMMSAAELRSIEGQMADAEAQLRQLSYGLSSEQQKIEERIVDASIQLAVAERMGRSLAQELEEARVELQESSQAEMIGKRIEEMSLVIRNLENQSKVLQRSLDKTDSALRQFDQLKVAPFKNKFIDQIQEQLNVLPKDSTQRQTMLELLDELTQMNAK